MKDGFVKVAAATPQTVVADPIKNVNAMIEIAEGMCASGVRLLAFPELSVTGYTCGDLFLQDTLLEGAKEALYDYVYRTAELNLVSVLGMPLSYAGKLYNTAVVVCMGQILGVVPKTYLPNYGEFYEQRWFFAGDSDLGVIELGDEYVPFGTDIIFNDTYMKDFSFAVEICEDLWASVPPSSKHAPAGAHIIINLSASDEITGKAEYRRSLVKAQSAKTLSAYVYADAGEGESTTDMVFSGHNIIAENGKILAESKPFSGERAIISEIDIFRLRSERRRISTFAAPEVDVNSEIYNEIEFDIGTPSDTVLTRKYNKTPFVPDDERIMAKRVKEILDIQAAGLKKRLLHTGAKNAVIGLSGGLDSTLALLVTVRAFDNAGLSRSGIISVTMPCFGTTDRTHDNAVTLAKELGTDFREIDIKESVLRHFSDIGQDETNHDITYENAQARERTQVLMDIANQVGGLVVGTGDLSELALGWATYNGDHMSMYGVNSSVPKTLIRYLVKYFADSAETDSLKTVLNDILDTPVSPELLPPEGGDIAQKTEDIVGPYELHDFFLYHMLRTGATKEKIRRLAGYAFRGEYDAETIDKWLAIFMKRFFSQQFKRSCVPDGPKVGTVSLSPRGDLRMPSDASSFLWL